jgi:MFS family permease
MMWLVAALCALFSLMGVVGSQGMALLVLFFFAVVAHVAGNALGTRLRRNGDTRQSVNGADATAASDEPRRLCAADFAPTTSLSERFPLGLLIVVMTIFGALLGALVGGYVLAMINWERATWFSMVFGALFSGVLGGIAGFLASSFIRVMIGALLQAERFAFGKQTSREANAAGSEAAFLGKLRSP